jgi:hypothetical protein
MTLAEFCRRFPGQRIITLEDGQPVTLFGAADYLSGRLVGPKTWESHGGTLTAYPTVDREVESKVGGLS